MCWSLVYVFSLILLSLPAELSLLQEMRQQPPGRHSDLPFSHRREAFPSHAVAAVKPGGETPTQSISLMECAGNRPEGVRPVAVCAQLRGRLFPRNPEPGQTAAGEMNCSTSLVSRRLLCGENRRVWRTPPAVS